MSEDGAGTSGGGPVMSPSGGYVLFITGLHEEAEDEDVFDVASEFGDVTNIHLNRDRRTGFAKGYCLLELKDRKAAIMVRDELDGSTLLGKEMKVSFAFRRGPKRGDLRKGSAKDRLGPPRD